MSRLNFLAGIMSYVSGPLWLGFMLLALWSVFGTGGAALIDGWKTDRAVLLVALGVTAVLLFGSKLISLAAALADRERRRQFGGAARLILSVVLETVMSVLIAPIMMALHTRFVLSVLAGRNSGWGPQRRDAGAIRWRDALRAHGLESLLGLGVGAYLLLELPQLAWWLLPVVGGLLLSVPISVLSSRASFGRAARRLGLALSPPEVAPPRELRDLDRLIAGTKPDIPAVPSERSAPGLPELHLVATDGVPAGATVEVAGQSGSASSAQWHEQAAPPAVPAWLARQSNAG